MKKKPLKKKIRRPKEGRMVAGVAAAFANYFGVDIVWSRLVWAFLFIPGGPAGLLPYLLCWLVIPEEDSK